MAQLTWLTAGDTAFPPVELAMNEPNGLLAAGGDLSVERLVNAYRHGIFPWYAPGQPILWWCPAPRTVVYPENLHISRSMRKLIRQGRKIVTFDQDFPAVIKACAAPRRDADGTWITTEMQDAYIALHQAGIAHSVEVWEQEQLVGGLYGVALGKVFFGESMFSKASNASKLGFITLVEQLQHWGVELIDCQMPTDHLFSLGAQSMPRDAFLQALTQLCPQGAANAWPAAL